MNIQQHSEYNYEVESLADAINLALEWKEQGKFDWFRGQRLAWPLKTTLSRQIEKKEYDKAEVDIKHLIDWFSANATFKPLLDQKDAIWAVAQHYGLPTNFLDFTIDPQVAGFFATSRYKSDIGSKGCIFCLSTYDLHDMQAFLKKGLPNHPFLLVEPIQIEVDNLWRHQAQHGRFLYLPVVDMENVYPLHKIFFTHNSSTQYPVKPSFIYPKRKSQLEIALDQYFEEKRIREGAERFRKFAEECNIPIKTFGGPKNYEPSFFSNGLIPKHSSWRRTKIECWHQVNSTNFHEYYEKKRTIAITIDNSTSMEYLHLKIREALTGLNVRDHSFTYWRCKVLEYRALPFSRSLNKCLNSVWDGMSYYPYSLEEKIAALSQTIELACRVAKYLGKTKRCEGEIRDYLLSLDNSLVLLDVGLDEGAFRKVLIPPKPFCNSIRRNIRNYVKPEYQSSANHKVNIVNHLRAVRNPAYLFPFNQFRTLFAQYVIPYQAICHYSGDGGLILYNPAEIDVFSLA